MPKRGKNYKAAVATFDKAALHLSLIHIFNSIYLLVDHEKEEVLVIQNSSL